MNLENFISASAGVSGGFIGGLLLGFALKKVVKLIAVIVGLFIAGLTYLQYHQIASFNWDKIEGTLAPLANKLISTFNDYNIETLGYGRFWYTTYQ